MGVSIGTPWANLFKGVAQQGEAFEESPIDPDGNYYAFLSKVDLDDGTGLYDVLFEIVSKAWMDNAVFSRPISIPQTMPPSPALLYSLRDVEGSTVLKTLGLTTADDLAEGSWYLINLSPQKGLRTGDELDTPLTGDLFDPAIDSIPG